MNTNTKTDSVTIVDVSEVESTRKKANNRRKNIATTILTKDDIVSSFAKKDDHRELSIKMPTPDAKTKALATIVDTGQINFDNLSEADKHELIAIGNKLNVYDISTVTNFGSELQRAMNDTSKALLSSSRASKVGPETEAILKEMMSQISEIDISEIKSPNSVEKFLRKIPIVNKLFKSVERFMAKYESLETTVEKCENNLHAVNIKAKSDNRLLQGQFDDTNEYIAVLEKFIVAGKNKSNELQIIIDEMEANANQYTPIQISDMKDFKHDLDLRLTNMLTWRTTFMQSLYRIREIQKANISLSNNVQQTIDNMMPMLRHQLSEAVALYNLKQGIQVVDAVQKGFNDILANNADMTHDAVVAVRQQTENTVVRMETLRHTQERLLATMRDAQKVCEEGAAKRREQEKELAKMNIEIETLASGIDQNIISSRPSAKSIEEKYIN